MDTRTATRIGLLAALTAVATMIIHFPVPGVQGFVNFGDSVIILAALLFGPAVGFFAGAIGSGLADVLLGYPHWALWTFIIKGLEGLIAGRMRAQPVVAGVLAAVWMVFGYFVAAGFMYGWPVAAAAIPGDGLQGGVSVIVALLLYRALRGYVSPR